VVTILLGLAIEWKGHSGRALAGKPAEQAVQEVQFKQESGRVEVSVGGAPFTTYYFEGYNKPIFFPLRAASGTIVTRSYPMVRNVPGESQDHPHHKGLWLTHGNVNGIDFWSEAPRGGKIVHRRFERIAVDSKIGILRSQNDWLSSEGERVLDEVREVRIQGLQRARIMDFEFKLTALQDSVKFGDTKEGTFGIRLAQPFSENQGGSIENSRGGVGEKQCWGKQAEWVDFTASIKGETLGVAIFDHPGSFRHPTYWHVRGYTLFAANPFGLHDFCDDPSRDGSHTLRKGESLLLRYRVLIHAGTTQSAKIPEEYKAYVQGSKFTH
jgi:hypothetical protein